MAGGGGGWPAETLSARKVALRLDASANIILISDCGGAGGRAGPSTLNPKLAQLNPER